MLTRMISWLTDHHCLETSKLGECEFFLISEMNSQRIIHQAYRTLTTLQPDLGLSQDEVALAWSIINDHFMTDLPLLYPPHTVALTAILLSLVLRPSVPGGQGGAGTAAAVAAAAVNVNMAAASAALAHAHAQAQARAAIQNGNGGNGGMTPLASTGPAGQLTPQQGQVDTAARERAQDNRSKVQRFALWLADSNVDIEAMVDCTQEMISFYECYDQYNEKNTREQVNRFIKARGLDR